MAWLVLLLGGCAREPSVPLLDVELTEVLVLGADEDAPAAYLLDRPRHVVADRRGRIYVAETELRLVRVYDADGTHLHDLGREGQGPGAFARITALHLDAHDRLLVYDRINARVTVFASDGQVAAMHTLDEPLPAFEMRLLGEAPLLLYHTFGGDGQGDLLFHHVDPTFQTVRDAFAPLAETTPAPTERYAQLLAPDAGSFTAGRDTVVYAPSLYTGRLYQYTRRTDGWTLTQTWRGYVDDERPYVDVPDARPDDDRVDAVMHLAGGTRFGVRFPNQSKGLFRLRDGRYVHFTFRDAGDARVFGVEWFGADGRLLGYSPLRSVPKGPGGTALLRWEVAWKDGEDRFYLLDQEAQPVVRVVRLTQPSESGAT